MSPSSVTIIHENLVKWSMEITIDLIRHQRMLSLTRNTNIHNIANTMLFWNCLDLIKEIELKYAHTRKVYILLLENIACMSLHYLEIVYSSKVLELLQFL